MAVISNEDMIKIETALKLVASLIITERDHLKGRPDVDTMSEEDARSEAYHVAGSRLRLDRIAKDFDLVKKSANVVKGNLDTRYANLIVQGDIPEGVKYEGHSFTASAAVSFSYVDKEDGVGLARITEWLSKNDHPDVIKETVHASTRDSILRKIYDENGNKLPDDLAEIMKATPYYKVSQSKVPGGNS